MYEGPRIAGAVLMAIGFLMLAVAVGLAFAGQQDVALAGIVFGALFLLAGAFLATGCLTKLKTTVG